MGVFDLRQFNLLRVKPVVEDAEVDWVDVSEGDGLGDAFLEAAVERSLEEWRILADEALVDDEGASSPLCRRVGACQGVFVQGREIVRGRKFDDDGDDWMWVPASIRVKLIEDCC